MLNRRFVNFYYDMTPEGVAHDPDAEAALRKLNPDQLNIQETLNPHVVLVSPDGEYLEELHGYSHPDTAVKQLKELLRKHPEWAKPTEAERTTKDPLEKARVLVDLNELEVAAQMIAEIDSDEARLLRGRIARLAGDVPAMIANLEPLIAADPENKDLRVEYAWRFWHERNYRELQDALADFPVGHPRGDEAQYLLGLSYYHTGERMKARDTWSAMIQGCSLSPWVYRADWAYFCTTFELSTHEGGERGMKPYDTFTPLNRHGYGYRGHPDLRRGKKAPFDEDIDPTMSDH